MITHYVYFVYIILDSNIIYINYIKNGRDY